MYSSTCFMIILSVLVMDVKTDIQPSRCYNCWAKDTTSCDAPSSWTTVTCPTDRPLCAITTSYPDFHSSMVCVPVPLIPCTVKAASNSSFTITWVCNSHLCNTPLESKWKNELVSHVTNSTDKDHLNVCELMSQYKNNTQQNIDLKGITEVNNTSRILGESSTETTTISVFPITNMHSILRDSERPKVEHLKQQPTVPSDDDEDESEGSGSYEESRIHNNAVSAPAAPSSYLPANENRASLLYKDLFAATLFIYLLV